MTIFLFWFVFCSLIKNQTEQNHLELRFDIKKFSTGLLIVVYTDLSLKNNVLVEIVQILKMIYIFAVYLYRKTPKISSKGNRNSVDMLGFTVIVAPNSNVLKYGIFI